MTDDLRTNPNQPATRGDLADMRDELTSSLIERITQVETNILRAIYGYTQTIQAQVKGVQIVNGNLQERMTIIEDRILEVEKRLNVPPRE